MLLPYTGLWADLIEFPDGGNVIVTSGSCTYVPYSFDDSFVGNTKFTECIEILRYINAYGMGDFVPSDYSGYRYINLNGS